MPRPKKKRDKQTSIRVDPELWKRAKIQAIELGITVTQLLNEALRDKLKELEEKEK